jgi:hypothetical protein
MLMTAPVFVAKNSRREFSQHLAFINFLLSNENRNQRSAASPKRIMALTLPGLFVALLSGGHLPSDNQSTWMQHVDCQRDKPLGLFWSDQFFVIYQKQG